MSQDQEYTVVDFTDCLNETEMPDIPDFQDEESARFPSGEQVRQQLAGLRPKTSTGRPVCGRPVGQKEWRRVSMGEPVETSARWERSPERGTRCLHDSVREAVNDYLQAASTTDRCRLPSVSPPKFEAGGDWRCFLSEFEEMAQLADLKPSHQLAYLKQAIPVEAKRMLYQLKVETIDQAKKLLQELYEPERDMWAVLNELKKVQQKPGERLRVLAGRIKGVAQKYADTLEGFTEADLNALVAGRFKQAIADEETRNHLLWDHSDMSLDDMVRKAQNFQDTRSSSTGDRKAMRTQAENAEFEGLKKQIAELQKQLEQLNKTQSSARSWGGTCWNCGGRGHRARNCPKPTVKDGQSFRPKLNKNKSTKPLNE